MDGIQLSQDYTATTRRQFTFHHSVPRSSSYPFNRPLKDGRLTWPWSHPAILNSGPLDWECSALTTRPLLKIYLYHSLWFYFPLLNNVFSKIFSFFPKLFSCFISHWTPHWCITTMTVWLHQKPSKLQQTIVLRNWETCATQCTW